MMTSLNFFQQPSVQFLCADKKNLFSIFQVLLLLHTQTTTQKIVLFLHLQAFFSSLQKPLGHGPEPPKPSSSHMTSKEILACFSTTALSQKPFTRDLPNSRWFNVGVIITVHCMYSSICVKKKKNYTRRLVTA